MTPVMQTRFYDPAQPAGQQRGNCLQAVVASVLDLPLDDVPNFVQIDVDGGRNWWDHLVGWLWERGHAIYGDLVRQPGEYYLASGPSPRGQDIHHVVIYRDDEMVHDPHPDWTGLLGITNRWLIRPIEGERMQPGQNTASRHPATTGMLRWFAYDHLRDDLRAVSQPFGELAYAVVDRLPDGPELTTCLRKLLEAKDCAVRAAIEQRPT